MRRKVPFQLMPFSASWAIAIFIGCFFIFSIFISFHADEFHFADFRLITAARLHTEGELSKGVSLQPRLSFSATIDSIFFSLSPQLLRQLQPRSIFSFVSLSDYRFFSLLSPHVLIAAAPSPDYFHFITSIFFGFITPHFAPPRGRCRQRRRQPARAGAASVLRLFSMHAAARQAAVKINEDGARGRRGARR